MLQFLTDNILLLAIALLSGGMLLWPILRKRAGGPALTTLQATQLINSKNAQIVDVRTVDEFKTGSIVNAKNIPAAALKDRIAEIKKEKPVIIVCATGARASGPAVLLRGMGYGEVYVLAGGLAAWREAGLPVR
ncbi:MAG: rhodanese-like domain-containing protein [Burkholderiaceae bacterium]